MYSQMNNFESYESIDALIAADGESISSTSGISMYPMLRHRRDTVVIEKINRPLKKHDVPLYRAKSGKLLLHRILRVKSDCYVIRGDNTYSLEYVPKESVIGVLREFYRNGKHYVCATSKKYKVYVFFMRLSYPLRYLWKVIIKPFLSKIKHKIFN